MKLKKTFISLLVLGAAVNPDISIANEIPTEIQAAEVDLLPEQILALEKEEELKRLEEVKRKEEALKKSLVSTKIPMNIEHQSYLYDLCKARNLDYIKTLAIVKHESNFNPNAGNKVNFGYMQIAKVNHARLARVTQTENNPKDPYVNLNWGTQMLKELYTKYSKTYSGDALDRAVWSAYQKGCGGFARTGEATKYVERNLRIIKNLEKTLNINQEPTVNKTSK